METVLLLSSGRFLAKNPKIFDKPFNEMKMAYVITAAKGAENTSHLERRKAMFEEQKYNYQEVDIDGKSESELRELLKDFEIVFVEGGNSFYLLKSIKETGFDKVIKELLPQGLIYMGASAGSYVACPTIEMATWKHQDKYDHYRLTDLQAMNLVPFLITVHYKPEYDGVLKKGISHAAYPVKVLSDEQAILIRDGRAELLGYQEEIKL